MYVRLCGLQLVWTRLSLACRPSLSTSPDLNSVSRVIYMCLSAAPHNSGLFSLNVPNHLPWWNAYVITDLGMIEAPWMGAPYGRRESAVVGITACVYCSVDLRTD